MLPATNLVQQRIEKLRSEVERLRYRYHVLNDPAVTDEAYTSLRHELLRLEEKYPEFKISHSPTERVAGKPLDKFRKTVHLFRQWSLDDAFDYEELKNWEEKNQRILEKKLGHKPKFNYLVEGKIDGLHVILTYRKGMLKTGATRGDGAIGENVTQNIKIIESIPLMLKEKVDVVVEGECWLSKKELERINKDRGVKKETLFANARNAAAGSIRQLDPKVAASRKLDSFIYQIHPIANGYFPYQLKTQADKLKILEKLGFKVNKFCYNADNITEVDSFFRNFEKKRNKLAYGVDGLVIKINALEYQEKLGFTGKSPRWGVAYKFPAETTTTTVENIQVQVGRTGALTPIAVLRAVPIAGSIVSRATLHNEEEIKRLDIRIGDTIILRKAGDIIPEVVEALKNLRSGKEKIFRMPAKCPICESLVEKRYLKENKKEAAIYCSNKKCFAQEKEKLIHFASKKGFGIEGLGEKIVNQLMENGLVRDFSDVFQIKEGDLIPLERFAELSAKNLVEAIKNSRHIQLEKFITALGIRYIGEETSILSARFLAGKIKSKGDAKINVLAGTAQKTSREEWQSIKGIGDKAADSLFDYFHDRGKLKEIKLMGKLGVKIILGELIVKNTRLSGVSFVFTGALPSLSRDEAKEMARSSGGEISGSVSKNTGYVVAGSDPGSKLERAKELGVRVIGEEEFLKLIKSL